MEIQRLQRQRARKLIVRMLTPPLIRIKTKKKLRPDRAGAFVNRVRKSDSVVSAGGDVVSDRLAVVGDGDGLDGAAVEGNGEALDARGVLRGSGLNGVGGDG